jgi:hypothetical protein
VFNLRKEAEQEKEKVVVVTAKNLEDDSTDSPDSDVIGIHTQYVQQRELQFEWCEAQRAISQGDTVKLHTNE